MLRGAGVIRSIGLILAVLLLGGCDRSNPRSSVTVQLPPAQVAPAPGFSSAAAANPARG